mmetsp:Transcript_18292/g.63467  ORF Transcript_18292/g.63467 Transcript_18292/m.63467 type:complete len:405 (-) Transcript_18292:110-1324(-)
MRRLDAARAGLLVGGDRLLRRVHHGRLSRAGRRRRRRRGRREPEQWAHRFQRRKLRRLRRLRRRARRCARDRLRVHEDRRGDEPGRLGAARVPRRGRRRSGPRRLGRVGPRGGSVPRRGVELVGGELERLGGRRDDGRGPRGLLRGDLRGGAVPVLLRRREPGVALPAELPRGRERAGRRRALRGRLRQVGALGGRRHVHRPALDRCPGLLRRGAVLHVRAQLGRRRRPQGRRRRAELVDGAGDPPLRRGPGPGRRGLRGGGLRRGRRLRLRDGPPRRDALGRAADVLGRARRGGDRRRRRGRGRLRGLGDVRERRDVDDAQGRGLRRADEQEEVQEADRLQVEEEGVHGRQGEVVQRPLQEVRQEAGAGQDEEEGREEGQQVVRQEEERREYQGLRCVPQELR